MFLNIINDNINNTAMDQKLMSNIFRDEHPFTNNFHVNQGTGFCPYALGDGCTVSCLKFHLGTLHSGLH